MQAVPDMALNETWLRAAGSALLDKIEEEGAILITHSSSGAIGWHWADARPEKVKAIVAVEPVGPPFRDSVAGRATEPPMYGITTMPLTYCPALEDGVGGLEKELFVRPSDAPEGATETFYLQREPARQLPNLRDMPILVETGEASYHVPYDHCTVAFLKQAGCKKVEHLKLWERGIMGNGHMQFMELNNLEIAAVLEDWIKDAVEMC